MGLYEVTVGSFVIGSMVMVIGLTFFPDAFSPKVTQATPTIYTENKAKSCDAYSCSNFSIGK